MPKKNSLLDILKSNPELLERLEGVTLGDKEVCVNVNDGMRIALAIAERHLEEGKTLDEHITHISLMIMGVQETIERLNP